MDKLKKVSILIRLDPEAREKLRRITAFRSTVGNRVTFGRYVEECINRDYIRDFSVREE